MLPRSSVLSASISVGLTIALLAQPVAAQPSAQAQPTPTPPPTSDVLVVSPDNVPVLSATPINPIGQGTLIVTNQTWNPTDPAALMSQPAPSPLPVVIGCGGPTHIFQGCPINVRGGPDHETVLEQQAIGAVLQQHALPASEATRVMHSARNSVRAALFAYLVAAFEKSPGSRSTAEQAAVDGFTGLVRQKHVQAAKIAQSEYAKWASSPCRYTPPAGFSYNAASACIGASQMFTPASPGLQAFQAYGAAGAYQTSQIDAGVASTYGATSSAALLGYGYAAALGAGTAAAYIGTMVPLGIFTAVFPYAVGTAGAAIAGVNSGSTVAASIGASAPAGVTGAAAIGGTVLIVVAAVVTAVVAGISVFTEAAIPGQLQDAQTAAQAYDIGPAITSSNATARTAAVQELYAAFLQSTRPEFASTDPVPAPQPSDPQFVVQGQKTSTLQYTAWDGSHRTARLSGSWMIDAPDSGAPAALALFLQVLDPAGVAWIASPVGTQFVVVKVADPADPASPHQRSRPISPSRPGTASRSPRGSPARVRHGWTWSAPASVLRRTRRST
jgi:hypothetical protein